MNKKLLIPMLSVFAIGLVMAGYYAVASYTISINQPIEVTGPTEQGVDCDAGETCRLGGITVTNDGDDEREILVSDNADSYSGAIDDIRYIGLLQLSEKDTDDWELEANKINIEYVVVGDEFSAEVVDGEEISGYELVYYADDENAQTVVEREASPQPVIRLSEISVNLPYSDDGNWQEDTDYSVAPDEYNQWKGAKLWYVPTDAIDEEDNTLDWSQWDSFYYETDLIQYNSAGEIVLFPGATITIYPEVDINKYASEGERTLDVTIA